MQRIHTDHKRTDRFYFKWMNFKYSLTVNKQRRSTFQARKSSQDKIITLGGGEGVRLLMVQLKTPAQVSIVPD